jgi:Zn-finger nucleic acid-binding protein
MRLESDLDFFQCDYCRSVYFPEPNSDGVRILAESASLACPVCDILLVHAAIGEHRMFYCTRCRGMLIGMDRFMAIIQELRSRHETVPDASHQPDWRDLNRHIRCPQCAQLMDAHPYGGPGNVILDACENCSLDWLDYGELDKIVHAPDYEYSRHAWDPTGAPQRP